MRKNILVGQSGGPTAAINASLWGVVTEGKRHPDKIGTVYGMINGVEGFLAAHSLDLARTLSDQDLGLLKTTPAAYLGSCRYKLPSDLASPFYPSFFEKLEKMDIGYFLYIGGNDSMDTVSKLSRYAVQAHSEIRFLGVPKTIDNDLVLTDHTPGYGSAAKYVAATVREIVLDACAYHSPSVTIIELMGRHAGWLTAASALARKEPGDNPLLIYLPESTFDFQSFANDLSDVLGKKTNVVVCVSEGISNADGTLVCEYNTKAALDTFGHKMLTGCAKVLENFVRSEFHCKVRSIELNVSQRCCGMAASLTDLQEAAQVGIRGVRAALDGATGKMVSMRRLPDGPYRLDYTEEDVDKICNQEKTFPTEWITCHGTDIGPEFLSYARPLIIGEPAVTMEDGIPKYLYR